MSAMEEMSVNGEFIPEGLWKVLAAICWAWADAHAHDVVLKKKILFVSITILVKDCEWLISSLIGPRP